MKNSILILLIILTTSAVSFAQEKVVCPNIQIAGPAISVFPGETIRFTVSSIDRESKSFNWKYRWAIDKGKIIEGQSTNSILVMTEGLENESVVAKVEILGLPTKCKNEFSEMGIVTVLPHIHPIDEFENIKDDDARARIDAFFIELQNLPDTKGYVVNYGKQKNIRKRIKLIKNHIKLRKFDEDRIEFVFGGKTKGIRTKLWVLPEGFDVLKID